MAEKKTEITITPEDFKEASVAAVTDLMDHALEDGKADLFTAILLMGAVVAGSIETKLFNNEEE